MNGKTVFQTERDPWTRVLFNESAQPDDQSFEVDLRDGRILTYGSTAASRHSAPVYAWEAANGGLRLPSTLPLTYAWALDSVTDPSGNQMTVSYTQQTDTQEALAPAPCTELLPQTISYTAGALTAPLRSVTFIYENSPAPEPSCRYVAGFGIGAQARIRLIEMFGPGPTTAPVLLRGYSLTYEQSPMTQRSLLQAVQACTGSRSDTGWPGNECMPATTFDYDEPTSFANPSFVELPQALSSLSTAPASSPYWMPSATQFVNLNQDGKDDVVFLGIVPGVPNDSVNPPWLVEGYALSNGAQVGPPHVLTTPPPNPSLPGPGPDTDPPYGLAWPFPVGPAAVTTTQTTGVSTFINSSLGTESCVWYNSPVAVGGVDKNCAIRGAGATTPLSSFSIADDSWTPGLRGGWEMAPPYFLADLDGNGSADLLGTRPSGAITWAYWLNNNAGFSTTPPKGQSTIAVRTMSAPDMVPSTTDSLYEYVAHVDGTGKIAFLFRSGAKDGSGQPDPYLVAVTANATTGDVTAQVTTLAAGEVSALAPPPPNCVASATNPCTPTFSYTPNATHFLFIDLNGDGNDDALVVPNVGGLPTGFSLNTGAGFGPVQTLPGVAGSGASFNLPAIDALVDGTPPPAGVVTAADLNGDGLPDLLIANNQNAADANGNPTGGPIVAYLSNGANGVVPVTLSDSSGNPILQGGTPVPVDQQGGAPAPFPYGVDVLDFNGDGRADIYANGHIYVQQGGTVKQPSTGNADQLTTVQDGLGNTTSVTYGVVGRDSATQMTWDSGASFYRPATTNCDYPIQCLQKGFWVVSSYTLSGDLNSDGQPAGPPRSFSFDYAGGRSDQRGRGWLGFAQVDSYDSATMAVTSTAYYDPGTDTGYGYPFAGAVQSSTVRSYSGFELVGPGEITERIQTTGATYDVVTTLGGQGAVIRAHELDSTTQEVGPSASYTTTLSQTLTTYGYDSDSAPYNLNARTTTWPISGETRVWNATYTQNTSDGKWLLSLLQGTSETSTPRGQLPVTRKHSYNPDPNTGLVENEAVEPGAADSVALTLTTTYTRDANGQPIHVVVSAGDPLAPERSVRLTRESWVTYDSFDQIFPSITMNGLGQTAHTVYDPGLGILAFSEDPNGVKLHSTYDSFGRPLSVSPDGQGATTLNYEAGLPYKESSTAVPGLFTVETSVAGGGDAWITYNSLGHAVVHGSKNHDGTNSYVETAYTGVLPGQVQTVSNPFAYGGTPILSYEGYDLMGRPVSTVLPDGSQVQTSYIGSATTVIDPRGYARTRVTDDQGRVVRVDEDSQEGAVYSPNALYQRPGTAVSTNYAYGQFALLDQTSVTARDSQGAATTVLSVMTYDTLGRRTSVLNADSGQSQTEYDAFGDATSTTDANGDQHILARDAIGRVIADYSTRDGASYFQFDTAPNGIGKIASATSGDQITTTYDYDAFGRSSATTWQIQESSYTIERFLDNYGRVQGLQYPAVPGAAAPFEITYGFDAIGAPSSAIASDNSVSWSAMKWETDGQLSYEQYGVDATGPDEVGATTRSYDPNRRWLTGIRTGGTTPVQALSYFHDASGNVDGRRDALAETTETFQNDFLNRLTNWSYTSSSGATNTTALSYNDLGDLQVRTSTGTGGTTSITYESGTRDAAGTPGEAGVHAITSAAGSSYSYDAKGNQTAAPTRDVTYTSFNLPRSVGVFGQFAPTTFQYDASHTRALKQGYAGASIYAGGLYEKRTDTDGSITHVFYVPGSQRTVAQVEWSQPKANGTVTETKVIYLHDDNLGSIESLSGATTGTQHFKYDPFGLAIDAQSGQPTVSASADVTMGFTDQEEDTVLGLINMHGRMYDPSIARFLSADPLTDLSSQGLNAYSYVANNPLSHVDPSGFDNQSTNPPCGPNALQNASECTAPGSSNNQGQSTGWWWSIDSQTGQITVGGEEVSVVAKPPLEGPETDDSNGPGLFGSTSDALSFYNGNTSGGPPASNFGSHAAAAVAGLAVGGTAGFASGYALAALSIACPVCGAAVGVGLLAYGAYSLVNGGAEQIWDTGSRIAHGEATDSDYFAVGAAVGGVAGGALGAGAATISAELVTQQADATITLYHGSVDNYSSIVADGLDPAKTPTWVTTDPEAAANAIGPDRVLSPGQGGDTGVVTSVVPAGQFQALQEAGGRSAERSWPGFGGGANFSEVVLRSEEAVEMFNSGIVRGGN